MRVVGCFLEFDDRFVILLRRSHKPDGNTWGLPSGKVESNESDEDAILRELHEETGYKARATELQHIDNYEFMSGSNQPYTYITYRIKLKDQHQLTLEDAAHADYKWVTANECYAKADLISGFHELLKLVGYIK
jgi:8-oxo-dGTP diphosphatase